MKKIVLIFITFASVLSAAANDEQYREAMWEMVESFESADTPGQTIATRNRFEMISKAYPGEWLPAYYVALFDLQAVYLNPRSEENGARLEDAKKYIDIVKDMDTADKSEVATLEGFYYMAMISVNSAENGPKLFSVPLEKFGRAIELDPANPRPLVMRVFYSLFLPDFIRPDIDRDADMKKAAELFASEEPNIVKPFWGMSYYRALAGDRD